MKNKVFSGKELLFLITISLALGIREMAMTMVMPFISTYSQTLSYSNSTLAGVALGIFGLTQAIFQIPFGIWSDKIGNKRVILIGLVIAFLAKSVYMLIFARALQGSGVVLATGYSWLFSSVDVKKDDFKYIYAECTNIRSEKAMINNGLEIIHKYPWKDSGIKEFEHIEGNFSLTVKSL